MKKRIFIWSSATLWVLLMAMAYLSLGLAGEGGGPSALVWFAVGAVIATVAVFTTRRAEAISQIDRIVGHIPAIVTVAMLGGGFGSMILALLTGGA